MNAPVQITFRNMESSPTVEEWIRAEAAKLETFYHSIMGCRVAIEVPHRHHRTGSLYHIRIDLTVPGGELVIKRQPSLRKRVWQEGEAQSSKRLEVQIPHKNLRLAIAEAFKAAGRRLQDYGRRQSGQVKTHELLPSGKVSKLFAEEGYGFLEAPDGREIYFHKDSVLNQGFHRLKLATTVRFAEEQGEKGPQASTVRIVRSRAIRQKAQGTTVAAGQTS